MTAGSFLSRIAWQKVVSCFCVAPSLNRNGTEDSTTSRCCVVPSRRREEGNAELQRLLRGHQQFGDLLLDVGALACHLGGIDR